VFATRMVGPTSTPSAGVLAQVDQLMHASNLYRVPVQTRFAERLLEVLQGEAVFLCNSGTEATEAAVKLVRKHHWVQGGSPASGVSPRTEVVVAENAFHGRSLMALALTPRPKYQAGFGPLPGDVKVVPVAELPGAVTDRTAAVFVEPVQGEGGCHPVPHDVLVALREACDRTGALLVFDEIQCGLGRTGELVHHPRPDIITLAKALGGGLPLGAMLVVRPELATTLGPGDHGSTFGGNPVACAAGLAVLDTIIAENLPARCEALGRHLRAGLEGAGATVRGRGLMLAAELGDGAGPVIDAMRERGVLVCPAGPTAVRFLPAFTSTEAEIDEMVAVFAAAWKAVGGA
jgi:acetylornithine/N-succinyldiaminopimelate aminotransferase